MKTSSFGLVKSLRVRKSAWLWRLPCVLAGVAMAAAVGISCEGPLAATGPAGQPAAGVAAGKKPLVNTTQPGRQDIKYSLDADIPHTPWGRPYARGPIKAWILSPIVPTGDTVSLLKRFDIDYDIVSCDMSWEMNTWGLGDCYGKRSKKDDKGRAMEFKYATEDLTSNKHYDVMIIPTVIGWNAYPKEMREAIVRRVKDGAGLVMISPQECKEQPADDIAMPALSPMGGATNIEYHWYGDWDRIASQKPPAAWKVASGQDNHPIVSGVCWESMPLATNVMLHDFKTVAKDATLIASAGEIPTIATRAVGKGRVVAINWWAGRHCSGLSPEETRKPDLPTWDYWEQFYNLLGRSTLWAASKEPQVEVDVTPCHQTIGNPKVSPIAIASAGGKGVNEVGSYRIILKDGDGRIVRDSIESAPPSCESRQVEVGLDHLPGGTNHIEVIALGKDKKALGWAATQVVVPKTVEIVDVKATPDAVKDGDELTGEVKLNGVSDKHPQLSLQLRDPYGRVLAVDQKGIDLQGEMTVPYKFKVSNPISLVVFVRATLEVPDNTSVRTGRGSVCIRDVATKDSADVVVTPAVPQFGDYEVIPWGFTSRRDLWHVKAEAYRSFNVTGNSTASPQVMREGFIVKGHAEPGPGILGVYWFDPERERLETTWKQYKIDGDKTKLTRKVCLSDPETFAAVEKAVREKVRAGRKFNPGVYFIGDESSVSAYSIEIDLDLCPKSQAEFRTWLKERYGTIEKLNAKWQTKFAAFDDIVPFTITEVEKDKTKATGWSEFRTFMELKYESLLALIRKVGKEEDPLAEFELTGTQSATSFNGMDWARHTRHVKRFVPYNINFAYDQLRCFNEGVRQSALTGYGSTGPGVKLSLWNQAMHGLLSANIFWEWSLVNPDFSISRNAADIGEVFAELRGRGIGRLLGEAKWVTSPVAVYYSQASIHAARTQGRESICHESRNSWCQLVRDLGLQFDMLSYLQVEEGSWLKTPPAVLVMPAALAVSPTEAAHLISYVENGGTIIADIDPGQCDDRCDFRENKLLEKLFGDGKPNGPLSGTAGTRQVGKGKAILTGKAINDYVKKRNEKRGQDVRAAMGKVLMEEAGARPTVEVSVPHGLPPNTVMPPTVPLQNAETVTMQCGDWRLVGILKENLTGVRKTTPDGVEYFEPLKAGQTIPPERISVHLPLRTAASNQWHAYDVRAGKYLGFADRITDTLSSAEVKLYSLLPYKVDAVKLTVDSADRACPIIHAEVKTAGGEAPGKHVFNIRVDEDQDTRYLMKKTLDHLFYFDRNVVADGGKAAIKIPIAMNQQGALTVTVTDVLTGTSTRCRLSIK